MSDDTERPKPTLLHTKPDAVAAAIANMERNEELLVGSQESLARIRKAAFDAYMKAGFSEEQALVLCTK